jgi:ribosomal protein L34
MKRTYQPSTRKRRMHGFRARMRKSPHVIKARRNKGRWKLTQV